MCKPFRSHILSKHPANCSCDCDTCSSAAANTPWLQTHFLCPKAPLLHGSDRTYHSWKCLELKCEQCFLNNPSLLLCERSGCTDPTVVIFRLGVHIRQHIPQQQPTIFNKFTSIMMYITFSMISAVLVFLLFGRITAQNSSSRDIS